MSDGWLQVAKEAVKLPALLSEIYGDVLKPGAKQVGTALETVIGLGNTVLWPVALANERSRLALQKNLEKYRAQIERLPEEKTVPVPPEVGVPIAEKLSYVSDEELSDMYINLLAKASSSDTAKFAHPSFVNVINNLCPDEAVLLKEVRRRVALPFVSAKLQKKNVNEWSSLGDLLTGLELSVKLAFPNNLPAYVSNFEGLGLIQVRRDIFIAQPELYEKLESVYRPQCEAFTYDKETHEVSFERGKIEATTFGRLFMDACLTKLAEG